jgi:hypothetical protein
LAACAYGLRAFLIVSIIAFLVESGICSNDSFSDLYGDKYINFMVYSYPNQVLNGKAATFYGPEAMEGKLSRFQ